MTLSERSRAALFQGLSPLVEEDALQEMLSFFPARDVEEPVTKAFLRAQLAELENRLIGRSHGELKTEARDLRTELKSEIADLRQEVKAEITDLRQELKAEITDLRQELKAEIADLRQEVKAEITDLRVELRAEIRRSVLMNAGMLIAFAGLLLTALRG